MSNDREQESRGQEPQGAEAAEATPGAADTASAAAPEPEAASAAATAPESKAAAPSREEVERFAASIPPRRPDGSEWPEIAGMKPGDPYYGVMLEQVEWEQRKKRRYSLVLAVQIAFIVAVIGIIIYFIVTAS